MLRRALRGRKRFLARQSPGEQPQAERGGGERADERADLRGVEQRTLDPLPTGGPLIVGGESVVPVAPGTLRVLAADGP